MLNDSDLVTTVTYNSLKLYGSVRGGREVVVNPFVVLPPGGSV